MAKRMANKKRYNNSAYTDELSCETNLAKHELADNPYCPLSVSLSSCGPPRNGSYLMKSQDTYAYNTLKNWHTPGLIRDQDLASSLREDTEHSV